MSGFIGLLNLDGKPVDRLLLQRLTNFLSFRGPDAQDTWLKSRVGFGLATLRTTPEDSCARPFGPDGDIRIVADARVDGRNELIASLRSHGQQRLHEAPD